MRLKTIAMMLTLGIAAGGEAPAQQAAPLNPTNFGLVSPQPAVRIAALRDTAPTGRA